MFQKRDKEAFDAFFKATWTNEQQELSFYYLGVLAAKREDYHSALGYFDKALVKNSQNIKARD